MLALNGKKFSEAVLPCVEAEFRIVVHHILHHPNENLEQDNFAGMVQMGIYSDVGDLVSRDRQENELMEYRFMDLALVAKKAKKATPMTPQKPVETATGRARAALQNRLKLLASGQKKKRGTGAGGNSGD